MKLDEHRKHGGELQILERLLRGVPRLAGAACVGSYELFDSEDKGPREAARAICNTCPALEACQVWRAGLSESQRPYGTVAGITKHTHHSRRAAGADTHTTSPNCETIAT